MRALDIVSSCMGMGGPTAEHTKKVVSDIIHCRSGAKQSSLSCATQLARALHPALGACHSLSRRANKRHG
ncbi:hypothetical protein VFPFJ_08180 [Purpureocillium lilacinum]|uniref:Uncharacterized protein n=1 Tax=Purpureocillium lilacinum TaxID=33203 RepID=A0A179H8C0_PURLI|nr:hypothetical protein VFPFJ_08180 [Purpureocillium lilacinum]OAQ85791.1 hypothetical protein VFPFJ_08180 [Purpureocillium lilacinum]